jgi:uncharacterized protein (TIGR02145 family)
MKKKYLIAIILLAFSVYMGCKKDDNNIGGGDGNPPVSNFEANITNGTVPLTVIFTDQSSNNPTSWQWEFGDDSTSTKANPSHTYNNIGSYSVVLTVTNANGTDRKVKIEYIYVECGPCPGIPTVTYEGQVYNTALIDNQCWLKENLNVGEMINANTNQANNGVIEKYCYDNDSANCDEYGGLYKWSEMMEYASTQGVQGICPPGWHIPTNDEWYILEGTVDSQYPVGHPIWNPYGFQGYDAGLNLKSTSGWYFKGNGTDLFGFSAFPGGKYYYIYGFIGLGSNGTFWSSTNSTRPWSRDLYEHSDGVDINNNNPDNGRSVRCLKD